MANTNTNILMLHIEEQDNTELFRALYSFSRERKVGQVANGHIYMSSEEYLNLMEELTFDYNGPPEKIMQREMIYRQMAAVFANKYNFVYLCQ